MRLTPREQDRLTIFLAAQLARARRARGLRLNVPEATALISDEFCEAARDGATLAEATARARAALGPDDVLPGTSDVLDRIEIEALFDDGSRLAVIDDPIGGGGLGDAAPGAVLTAAGPVPYPELPVTPLEVTNTALVPIAVTSHWHFFEANPRLRFDRAAAFGRRLHIPAGSSLRFEPSTTRAVELVEIGGDRVAIGFAGLVDGPLDAPGARDAALTAARERGYLGA
jgi:urease subunit gamma/beta